MKSFAQITRWLHTAVATLAIWSQHFVQDLFKKFSIENYWLLGSILIALVGIQICDFMANFAIDNLRWLRRLLAGNRDIEGDWVSIVVNTAECDKIIAAEYSRIRYHNGRFTLYGDTWSLDGKWKGNFCTTGSTYEERQLEYHYKTGINRAGGFGIMIFSPNDSLANSCICRYIDEDLKAPHATYSERLSAKLSKISVDDRRAAALKFANKFDQESPVDLQAALGRPIP